MTDQQKEPLMFESLRRGRARELIDDQRQIVESCRKRGTKTPQVAVVLDDMADSDALTKRQRRRARGRLDDRPWPCAAGTLGITWFISTQNVTESRGQRHSGGMCAA